MKVQPICSRPSRRRSRCRAGGVPGRRDAGGEDAVVGVLERPVAALEEVRPSRVGGLEHVQVVDAGADRPPVALAGHDRGMPAPAALVKACSWGWPSTTIRSQRCRPRSPWPPRTRWSQQVGDQLGPYSSGSRTGAGRPRRRRCCAWCRWPWPRCCRPRCGRRRSRRSGRPRRRASTSPSPAARTTLNRWLPAFLPVRTQDDAHGRGSSRSWGRAMSSGRTGIRSAAGRSPAGWRSTSPGRGDGRRLATIPLAPRGAPARAARSRSAPPAACRGRWGAAGSR